MLDRIFDLAKIQKTLSNISKKRKKNIIIT